MQQRTYRYDDFVMVALVAVLVCSNLIGPAKIAQLDLPLVGTLTFGAGVLFFSISWVFGVMLAQLLAKTGVEVASRLVTYRVVAFLKRAESEDDDDRHTDFNPFRLQ